MLTIDPHPNFYNINYKKVCLVYIVHQSGSFSETAKVSSRKNLKHTISQTRQIPTRWSTYICHPCPIVRLSGMGQPLWLWAIRRPFSRFSPWKGTCLTFRFDSFGTTEPLLSFERRKKNDEKEKKSEINRINKRGGAARVRSRKMKKKHIYVEKKRRRNMKGITYWK